jgi:hypothetical protein
VQCDTVGKEETLSASYSPTPDSKPDDHAPEANRVGVYDPSESMGTPPSKSVGVYDRPQRTGPSPTLLIALAVIILAILLVLAATQFRLF